MSTENDLCPVCRTDQPVKKDGTLGKHLADGEVCAGWNQQPVAAEAAQAEGNTAAPDADDDWDDEPDAGDDADSGSSEADPHALQAPAGDGGSYRWELTVKHPAIYLGEAAWHHANGLAAAAAAERAGYTVTGEAQWAGDSGGGDEEGTVLLTYRVPVG